ncbi:hypothetical protein A1O7_06092 [Cladophialophora yegresii CBS 114405]|uniref:Extracellular membrane protein CFEM domain-containing protein n=1 Tax=Cladophialophora yegresii CBS 114405 TaxID=1182544 RepID=W9WJJ3_9EURO|nr:uncharacterized protein A1O7_06092 [Cladophialophora yegresii CBS 114405]EXJ58664.1 hypothetical protein A1O7_06092 [Cladophialophora yegresii CBS 114405]
MPSPIHKGDPVLIRTISILDACLATIQGQVNSCLSTDYGCLCTQYQNLLTCYNNCPADPGVSTVQQQREQYCAAASAYPSSTSTPATTGSATSSVPLTNPTATTSSEAAVQSGFATGSGSASASATDSADSSNSASGLSVGGSLVAVALAGLGYIL